MSKPKLNVPMAQKPLTPEEEREQYIRAYIQKKGALAEGILMNLMQNSHLNNVIDSKSIAEFCDKTATEFMEVVYHQKVLISDSE